jgi:hypothetical protein
MCTTVSVAPRRVRLTNRRARASLLVAATLLGASGCIGTDAGTSPTTTENPVGIYVLDQVNRRALPLEIYRGPFRDAVGNVFDPCIVEIMGGEVLLNEDGTFTMNFVVRFTVDAGSVMQGIAVNGEYDARGSRVRMTGENGDESVATLRDGVLTLTEDVAQIGRNSEFAFRRQ